LGPILAGIGMWVFGIPNPTLWGSISAVASLVPGLGTALIFIPAVAYTYIAGNIPNAIGLLLWGTLIVGLVDNFLTPYLYSRSVDIHQLIMLFAVLGGLVVFGPIGFIFGPIVLAIFFSLIDIYQDIILEAKSL
jgi:predicted PurR-regulated permease PerM